jgi:hypothetical protein
VIDITFDFRSDTPGYGRPRADPDASSPTLRRYHQLLWSKQLPSGTPFMLDVTTPGAYLHHLSELGGVLVDERYGDPDLVEVAEDDTHHRSDPRSRARSVH